MNMFNRFGVTCFARFGETCFARFHHAALLTGALLLCASLGAHADDIEDANKLFKQGHHAQALDKVNGYLANKPKDAQARFLKGLILTEQAKTAEAIKIFTSLTEDYPELPEPFNNLAVLYAGQGQYDKAKQALEMAIRTHPSYATAHENLGDIYAKMASQAYDRALQLDRSNTATQTKLAMIQELFADGSHGNETSAHNTASPSKAEGIVPVTAPASKPDAQPEPLPGSSSERDEGNKAQETVIAWAAAWSAKNVDSYLSFYADDFKTPAGETREAWEAARRERINAPKFIRVDVRILSTQFIDSNHATVKFHQSYKSSQLKSSGNKTLMLVKTGGKWLIQEERAK
jgi:tetratricopeptide (TPR) repeat protein